METRLTLAMVVSVLLVVASMGAPVGRAESTSSASCSTSVRHDVFRTDAGISTVNETGSATSTVENTKVTVVDDSAFIRLKASNPNGYCVRYVVEISPEIVEPADLGSVESNNGSVEADWRAAQNLSSGTVYTRVIVTLPAGTSAEFAPSNLRVKSLAWTGEAQKATGGLFSGLGSLFGGESKLEQRNYEIRAPNTSDATTVPLTNEGNRIEEWQATFRLDGKTRPVSQDAAAPVYYSEGNGSVTFHFNNENAVVEFVAEPTFFDKAGHSWTSYWSSGSEVSEWLPFALVPSPAEGGLSA